MMVVVVVVVVVVVMVRITQQVKGDVEELDLKKDRKHISSNTLGSRNYLSLGQSMWLIV